MAANMRDCRTANLLVHTTALSRLLELDLIDLLVNALNVDLLLVLLSVARVRLRTVQSPRLA